MFNVWQKIVEDDEEQNLWCRLFGLDSQTRTTTIPALDISDNLSRDDDDDLSYDDSVESEEDNDKFDSTPTSIIISKRNCRRDAVLSKRVTINSLRGSKSLQKAMLQSTSQTGQRDYCDWAMMRRLKTGRKLFKSAYLRMCMHAR